MNELLKHQIDKFLGGVDSLPEELEALFKAISDAYDGFDDDRSLAERASDLSPQELADANIGLRREITELKQAEEALHKSEKRFRALIENGTDGILVLDGSGAICYGSPSFKSLLGYGEEENLGSSAFEFLHPEDAERAASLFSEIIATPGATAKAELRVLHKDGLWCDVEAIGANYLDDPAIEGIVVNLRDITARKEAEAAVQESEERFRALIENAINGILVLDADGTILYKSPYFKQMLGYEEADALGSSVFEFIHPDDVQRGLNTFSQLALQPPGSIATEGVRIRHKDGSWVPVEVRGINHLQHPAVGGIVINLQDITERKQAEQVLAESEAHYRLLAENIKDVIWTADMNLRATYVSPSITRMRGYTGEEAIAMPLHQSLPPASLALAGRVLAEELAAEESGQADPDRWQTLELELNCKDGSTIWVEMTLVFLRDSEGKPTGILGVTRDISERRRAEEELARVKREKDAQLVQSAKLASLGEMATGIAHEINQPLNIIKLTCSGLQRFMRKGKTISPETLNEELEIIDAQIERTRAIIDHMRNFARRSSDVAREFVDVNAPLQDCFKFVGEQTRLREIDVQMDLQELPKVMADSNKLEQVFLNIFTNARDAMDKFSQTAGDDYKKILKVRSSVQDGHVAVTISDTGGGIPQGHRDRIFEPFFTTKEVGKGTGLGLSISYSIVKDFDGTLEFWVEDGVGTTFEVSLPIADEEDILIEP